MYRLVNNVSCANLVGIKPALGIDILSRHQCRAFKWQLFCSIAKQDYWNVLIYTQDKPGHVIFKANAQNLQYFFKVALHRNLAYYGLLIIDSHFKTFELHFSLFSVLNKSKSSHILFLCTYLQCKYVQNLYLCYTHCVAFDTFYINLACF